MTIALIGPSGAGKGTQAGKIVSRFDWLHISTGDLFRECLAKQTALGILAKRYLHRGELVPDEVVDAVIEEWLLSVRPEKDILFDGFPRTRYQAESLDTLLENSGRKLDAVIYLQVPDEEILRRLPGRVICRVCQKPYHLEFNPPARADSCDRCRGPLYQRTDDTPDVISVRLKVSHRVTGALAYYYQKTDRLYVVDGAGSIDDVSRAMLKTIEAIQRQEAPAATPEETSHIQSLKGEVATPIIPGRAPHRSLDIILLGGPGSGKGTQAENLRTHLDLLHVATGDLFRENIKNQTDLGKLAKSYIDRGELVPDDVTEAMVRERLSRPDVSQGFLLDGFPRTLPQADALTEIMNNMGRSINAVLHIKVSDEEIVNRLSGRLICRNCQTPYHTMFKPPAKEGVCDLCDGELYRRDDDNPDTVRARLRTYHGQTAPLIEHYRKQGLLLEIDGEGHVSEVTERTLAAIQEIVDTQKSSAAEIPQTEFA